MPAVHERGPRGHSVLAHGLATSGGGGGGGAAPAPSITQVLPATGPAAGGTALVITGTGFQAGAAVTVDGTPATAVVVVSDERIECVTPAGAPGAAAIRVTNPDDQYAECADCFSYQSPAPVLTSIDPSTGPDSGGTAVTITGENFLAGAAVTFDGLAATSVVVVSPTQITCVTPPHAPTLVAVRVTNPDAAFDEASIYTYTASLPLPTVTKVAPKIGKTTGGDTVTVTGTNFVVGSVVRFGTADADTTFVSATELTAVTPPHAAGLVAVRVTNPDTQFGELASAFRFAVQSAITLENLRFPYAARVPAGEFAGQAVLFAIGREPGGPGDSGHHPQLIRYVDEHALGEALRLFTWGDGYGAIGTADPYPMIVSFKGKLVAVTRNPVDGKLWCKTSTDGLNWTAAALLFNDLIFGTVGGLDTRANGRQLTASRDGNTLYFFYRDPSTGVPQYRQTTQADLTGWSASAPIGTNVRPANQNVSQSGHPAQLAAVAFALVETATPGRWIYHTRGQDFLPVGPAISQYGTLGGAWSNPINHGGGSNFGGASVTGHSLIDRAGATVTSTIANDGSSVGTRRTSDDGTTWDASREEIAPNVSGTLLTVFWLDVPLYSSREYGWGQDGGGRIAVVRYGGDPDSFVLCGAGQGLPVYVV